MKHFDRERAKVRGTKRFFASFNFASQGIKYAFKYEQSFFIQVICTFLVIIFGLIFKIETFEWLLLFLAMAMVLGAEMFNSSIEATIDLISLEQKHLSKVAKDTASGAVLLFSLIAIIIGCFVFIPHILRLF